MNKKSYAVLISSLILGCRVMLAADLPAGGDAGQAAVTGPVSETMNSGGYTYVMVRDGTNEVWAACYETQLKVGDKVTIPSGMVVNKFHSPTLDRDFASIRFVSALGGNEAGGAAMASPHGASADSGYGDKPLPPGHPPVDGSAKSDSYGGKELPPGHPPVDGMSKPEENAVAGAPVTPIDPPAGGLRIADVRAHRTELAGKEVTVKGTVVKYTANIMGHNWIHLQDGSGKDQADGDIAVTSGDTTSKGAVIAVRGSVAIDQDFGYGYSYPVLIEKASIVKE